MAMRTANPALGDNTFSGLGRVARAEAAMSIQGTTNKALLLLLCVFITAAWTWSIFFKSGNAAAIAPLMGLGAIAGFIVALVTIFKPAWAGVTAPIYALLEGLFIGGLSSIAARASSACSAFLAAKLEMFCGQRPAKSGGSPPEVATSVFRSIWVVVT